MAIPITRLELRAVPIPHSAVVERIERETGRDLSHEHRHFLADRPVHCGDMLEIYSEGRWIPGRYEWTGRTNETPTLETAQAIIHLDGDQLLRWPK